MQPPLHPSAKLFSAYMANRLFNRFFIKIKLFLLVFLPSMNLAAQDHVNEDSLKTIIGHNKEDTGTYNALIKLAFYHNDYRNYDSSLKYAQEAYSIAKKIGDEKKEANCLFLIGMSQIDYIKAIQSLLNALNIYETLKDSVYICNVKLILQANYRDAMDFRTSLIQAFSGVKIAEAHHVMGQLNVFPGHRLEPLFLSEIGGTYIQMNQPDSGLIYAQKAVDMNELFNGVAWEFPVYLLATVQRMKGEYDQSLKNYRRSLLLAIQNDILWDTLQIYSGMSSLFIKIGKTDSAIHYANIVARSWELGNSERKNILEAIGNLAAVYKLTGNKDSIIKYAELNQKLKDSFYGVDKDREIQNISFNEKLTKEKFLASQAKYRSRVQLYGLTAGICALLVIAVLLWRSNKNQQKSKAEIEKAYAELKATQAQLIQSEKMASLGELTAGIAHEIQNPLNFVNNFSEVNKELMIEMKDEIDKGNLEGVKSLANDMIDNEEKINHHGRRADAIVKGMLQHSRTSEGLKEPSDINALADEYLRLSFHGFRAREKTFNVTIKTDFDQTIGKINMVAQDIGRVLLNLYNNAFYAVSEKKKQNPENYEPLVSVSTKKLHDKIEIIVRDNGGGISPQILNKIFQPFFTTKPAGAGTGLGLSLSYDTVRSHAGILKVESKEGEETAFIIDLPI
jgi:two-component system, NtrC family, sensor kinase